jgi:hypothetical protein
MANFRDALAAFRREFEARNADQKAHFNYCLTLEVLDRRHAAGDCENNWERLGPKLEMPAELFIGAVIRSRVYAKQSAAILREWPKLEGKVRAQEKRHLSNNDIEGLEKIVSLHAAFDRARATYSQKTVTAARQDFIIKWSRDIELSCGKPHDREVAALTEIAFDERISTGWVRKTRKQNRTICPPK